MTVESSAIIHQALNIKNPLLLLKWRGYHLLGSTRRTLIGLRISLPLRAFPPFTTALCINKFSVFNVCTAVFVIYMMSKTITTSKVLHQQNYQNGLQWFQHNKVSVNGNKTIFMFNKIFKKRSAETHIPDSITAGNLCIIWRNYTLQHLNWDHLIHEISLKLQNYWDFTLSWIITSFSS